MEQRSCGLCVCVSAIRKHLDLMEAVSFLFHDSFSFNVRRAYNENIQPDVVCMLQVYIIRQRNYIKSRAAVYILNEPDRSLFYIQRAITTNRASRVFAQRIPTHVRTTWLTLMPAQSMSEMCLTV